jgi:hypothetical protein
MMKRIGMSLLIWDCWLAVSAKKETTGSLRLGNWRAIVEIQGQDLPFNLEIKRIAVVATMHT